MPPMKILILGGTSEASRLAVTADQAGFAPILSLAGRTRAPALPAVPHRIGGFGGVAGLVAYLRDQAIDALVDATHPFAAQISRHAALAADEAGVPRVALWRPEWVARPGDLWLRVPDMMGAVAALGATPRQVFLTVGQQELAPFRAAPWHHYLVRSVDPPAAAFLPPHVHCITARGPFDLQNEMALLRNNGIEVMVSKNSGATAVAAKLEAARHLGILVVMVDRPPAPPPPLCADEPGVMAWLHAHSARRGV